MSSDSMSKDSFWAYFLELYESTPRQGPGLDVCTEKALNLLPPLRRDQRLLDIGCGVGKQTLELARKSAVEIVATDLYPPFLEILKRQAEREGFSDRISTQVADMAELPFEDQSFDVLWAEGSIFIIGFARGLDLWRRLLKPGGFLVVSELTWLTDDPPAELRKFCLMDPEEDASLDGRRRVIGEAGYRLLDEFTLPREGWWDAYYLPVSKQLEGFERKYADNPDAMAVVAHHRQELDLFHRYGDLYGYTFFLMQG